MKDNKLHSEPLTDADLRHLQALLSVNNIGLHTRCKRQRRLTMTANVVAALCLLAIVPLTAVKTIPTHQDFICAISPSGHSVANAAAVSIKTMFCAK